MSSQEFLVGLVTDLVNQPVEEAELMISLSQYADLKELHTTTKMT